ncbi:sialic acid-binding Ig-like lectin 5 isoform X3 [Anarhichas minor]|uniref:sialic acid-binding Ig-like lectin 5 isoform X3 n=1 Tax=Anarhichas minor TaxID=65739 RepID=UPI003F7371FB
MFVLIWTTLLFSVRGITADAGAAVREFKHCDKEHCITLSEGEITAEAGLCVVIPCSFTTASDFRPQHIVWYKCEPSKTCEDSDVILHTNNSNKVQSGFKGRVSLLEPNVSLKNCSIIINDLTESDSGSYQLRVQPGSNGYIFSLKATVSVKGLTQKPTVMIPPLTEGQQTTLTCTAPGLCSGSDPNITWAWRGAGEKDSHITGNIITAVTQRHSSTLTFNSSAEQHGTDVTCKVSFTNSITTEKTVTLNVTYVKKPVITGMTSVKEGDALNLTCSVESVPAAVITWTKPDSNKNLQSENVIVLQNNTRTAALVIANVTAEYSGRYICTAKHQITTLTTPAEVNVKFFPKFLSSPPCEVQSEVLTCVCISEGFPLPTITWPMLETHTEYSVITNKSSHTVISFIVSVKHRNYTTVECVSSNEIGEAKKNLTVTTNEFKQGDLLYAFLIPFIQLQAIIAFVSGILLSATICCLAIKCCRNKRKNSGNMAEALEMVTTQAIPLIDAGQGVESDGTHGQQESEEGAQAAGQSAHVEPREVEYSDINFSLVKRKSPTGAEDTQETADTEYAEIKNKKTEERQDDGAEASDVLEGSEQEEVMIGEDKETKECMPKEEEGGEDVAVYSNVNEIMGEIETV